MSVTLQKGQKVSLSKDNPGLSRIVVGLGWDEAKPKKGGLFGGLFSGAPQDIDCDASAFLLQNGRLRNSDDVVYFGNLTHSTGAVQHMGDNLTGAGEGDDEQILIDLQRVPPQYDKIVIVVNIYAARQRNQHFGMIDNAFIRIVNAANGMEMLKYNLTENYGGMTAMIFGEIYRYNGEWKFGAVGSATNDNSVSELARRYQ
ncbi:MAG: TerD family protein [Clostridia bacterium]|nr:TerD family protein [Clostridia bacterium]